MADNNYTLEDVLGEIGKLEAKKEEYQTLSNKLDSVIVYLEDAQSVIRSAGRELAKNYQNSKRSSAISKAFLEQYDKIDGIIDKANATKSICASKISELDEKIAAAWRNH